MRHAIGVLIRPAADGTRPGSTSRWGPDYQAGKAQVAAVCPSELLLLPAGRGALGAAASRANTTSQAWRSAIVTTRLFITGGRRHMQRIRAPTSSAGARRSALAIGARAVTGQKSSREGSIRGNIEMQERGRKKIAAAYQGR